MSLSGIHGCLRESSFNMTRGDEDIEGGLRKFVYFKTNRRGGSQKIEPLARGAAKISSFEFQYLHPPLLY